MRKQELYKSEIILGLDIGKASVGFALVDKANNYKIINAGVRLFDAPEKPKEQTSLSKERGEFKRARNSNKNEFLRTKNIVKCMLKYNILNANIIREYDKSPKVRECPKSKKKHLFYIKTAEYLFYKKSNNQDVLHLRVKALQQKISNLELARILYNMNNHRGVTYDEIREIPEGSSKTLSEDQKNLKDGFQKYNEEYKSKENGYLTVGQYLQENYGDKFRNTDKWVKGKKVGKDYLFSIPRDDLKNELEIIFEKQREFKNNICSKEFQDEYLEHFLWEKESPKYDTLVSPCIYNPNEKSANKHHFSSQLYISLEKLYYDIEKLVQKNI
jgi:CRISPR-associated endonuclease Csn1